MNNHNHHIEILSRIANTLETRKPKEGITNNKSYVSELFNKGPDSFLKKIGEEATELVMAAKDGIPQRIISETADLWFHSLVLLSYYNLRPEDIMLELEKREGISGIEEKAMRNSNKT